MWERKRPADVNTGVVGLVRGEGLECCRFPPFLGAGFATSGSFFTDFNARVWCIHELLPYRHWGALRSGRYAVTRDRFLRR
jgi:hypothetical protein